MNKDGDEEKIRRIRRIGNLKTPKNFPNLLKPTNERHQSKKTETVRLK